MHLKQALFPQDHGGHSTDGFGHRIDAVDRVVCNGLAVLDIGMAVLGAVGQLASTRNGDMEARKLAFIDIFGEMGLNSVQTEGVKAQRGGILDNFKV